MKTFRKHAVLAIIMLAATLLTGCDLLGIDNDDDDTYISGVEIVETFTMEEGSSKQLTATVLPSEASDSELSWTSSNTEVATVDKSSGLINAISAGETTITVTPLGRELSAECKLTVMPYGDDILEDITDPVFLSYCLWKMENDDVPLEGNAIIEPAWDMDENGRLSYWEAEMVQIINLNNGYKGDKIASLEGIEFFTGIKYLTLVENSIEALDVSALKKLRYLECSYNGTIETFVIDCPELEVLYCVDNSLTSLDISSSTKLTNLTCSENSLTSLDVSNCTKLTTLTCSKNELTSLDVSKCTELTGLECGYNLIETLDISKCTNLSSLSCESNPMNALDLSGLTELASIICSNIPLKTLNVSECPKLSQLDCCNGQLSSLDLSNCPDIEFIYCGNNDLEMLNIAGCSKIIGLFIGDNNISELDVTKCKDLEYLYCSNNALTYLDLSECTKISYLDCKSNVGLDKIWVWKGFPLDNPREAFQGDWDAELVIKP